MIIRKNRIDALIDVRKKMAKIQLAKKSKACTCGAIIDGNNDNKPVISTSDYITESGAYKIVHYPLNEPIVLKNVYEWISENYPKERTHLSETQIDMMEEYANYRLFKLGDSVKFSEEDMRIAWRFSVDTHFETEYLRELLGEDEAEWYGLSFEDFIGYYKHKKRRK